MINSPHNLAHTIARAAAHMPACLLIMLTRMYQFAISPWLGPHCRFSPTCSEYMIESLRKHGAVKGLLKGLRRILKCHPLHPGGHDPP